MVRFAGTGDKDLGLLRKELQAGANRHLLILRDEAGLKRFRTLCREIYTSLTTEARIETAEDLVHAVELGNLIEVGDMMALAALNRAESRGSHYREDCPERQPELNRNIILTKAEPDGFFWAKLAELA